MSFSAVLELLGNFLNHHHVQVSTTESGHSALWHNNATKISVTAITDQQFLISIIRGSQVSSAVYNYTKNDDEEFGKFMFSSLSEGLSLLSPHPVNELKRPVESESGQKSEPSPVETRKGLEPNPESESKLSHYKESHPVGAPQKPSDMPGFDDEYELKSRNVRSSGAPFSIGDGDLYPAGTGPHPQLKPYIDPLAAPGSGMIPAPNHPMFGQGRSGNTSRLGVPPGARFDDPYGDDNLDDMGMGLPGNLRSPFGGSQSGPGFGGPGFGGSGFGPHFG